MQLDLDAIPPIIVSAERVTRNYKESTSTILSFGEEDFSQSGTQTVSEFLKQRSGINFFTSGAFGKASSLFLRGTSNRHTAIFIDGVRATDLTAIGGGGRLEFLNLANIESIEILKGSQGVLYGAEAIGGVINIKTKAGVGANVSLSYGSFEDHSLAFDLGGKTGNINYHLNGNYRNTEGISAFNEERGGVEKDGLRNSQVNGKVSHDGKKVLSTLQVQYQNNEFEYDNSTADADNEAVFDSLWLTNSLELKGEKFKPRIQFDYREVDREIIQNGTNTTRFLYDGGFYRGEFVAPFKTELSKTSIELISGISYEKEWTEALDSKLNDKRDRERTAIFSNARVNFGNLYGELGTRYEDFSIGGNESLYRVAAAYNLGDWTFKASQASGFKVASLYQSFSSFGNVNLNPELSISKEAGVTYNTAKTQVDVSVFYLRYRNFIDFDSTTNRYANLSSLKNEGVEVSVTHNFDKFTLNGIYNFLNSRLPDTGAYAPRRARRRFSVTGIYYILDELSVSLGANYVGERFESSGVRIPSYFLMDTTIRYQKNDDTIALSVNNLLDRSYEEFVGFGTPDRNFMVRYTRRVF